MYSESLAKVGNPDGAGHSPPPVPPRLRQRLGAHARAQPLDPRVTEDGTGTSDAPARSQVSLHQRARRATVTIRTRHRWRGLGGRSASRHRGAGPGHRCGTGSGWRPRRNMNLCHAGLILTAAGARFIRMTTARQSGSCRRSSGGSRSWSFSPGTLPHSLEARSRVTVIGDRAQQDLGTAQAPDVIGLVLAVPALELARGCGRRLDEHAPAGRVATASTPGRSGS